MYDLPFKMMANPGSKNPKPADYAGLDMAIFKKDLKDPNIHARVTRDQTDGAIVRVKCVPTVFINGKLLKNHSLQGLQALIEKEL
jgi:protein-disulfide isomerase